MDAPTNEASWKDLALLQFYVVIVGFTAILGDLISLPATSLVTWRTTLAGLVLFIWLGFSKKRSQRQAISLKKARNFILTGFLLGLHWLCFYGAIKAANASIALTGMAATSLFTAWIEPWITKRPFRREEFVIGAIIILGLSLVLNFALDQWFGLMLSVLAALFASIFPSYNRRYVQQGYSSLSITAYEMLGASIICGTATVLAGSAVRPTSSDWLWLGLLSGVCTVYAFALCVQLLKRMTAYTTALALNFEPVYGILLAAWLLNENEELDPGFYLGVLVLIGANLLHTHITARRRRKMRLAL